MHSLLLATIVCTSVVRPFAGTICAPNDGVKHPAMVLLGGSEGGNALAPVAKVFAQHGYVTASVAYFGLPGLPQYLVDVPVESVGRAITALQRRSDVDPARIGVLGGSRGGELALLAASVYRQIKAVVADVPSPYAFMGLGRYDRPTRCAWTLAGKELPCVAPDPKASQRIGAAYYWEQPLVLRSLYDASAAANPELTARATFALERIDGPVLCLAADDDKIWNSQAQCQYALSYLRERRHPFADRAITYPRAGHTFLWATRGPASAVTQFREGGVTMELGGTKDGDVAAAAQAWPAIWTFLRDRLGR